MAAGRKKKSESERITCFECDQICCRTAVIEVDPPKSFRDYSDLLFYLFHFDTEVVIAKNGGKKEWFVEFMTRCRFLVDGRCEIYEQRPLVCREYEMKTCERNRPGRFTYIRSADEFLDYVDRKGPKRIRKKLRKTHQPPEGYPPEPKLEEMAKSRTRVDRSAPLS
jgi:Fe-S-cluster containining protein